MKRRLIAWLLRSPLVQEWLLMAARPRASAEEVKWLDVDRTALAAFLDGPAGTKLLQELENQKADADADAVLRSFGHFSAEKCARARGVRAAVARLKTLSAARPSPGKPETDAVALPPDLVHLSDT